MADLSQHLDNPNVRKFLDLLAKAEGTYGPNGYRTNFGGSLLDDLRQHPNVSRRFKQTDGQTNRTTAAGRYQFLKSTWDEVAKAQGLKDFGPRSQDIGALALISRAGALQDVLDGNFRAAVQKTGKIWASLPSANVPQPRRSWEWVDAALSGQDAPSSAPGVDNFAALPPLDGLMTAGRQQDALPPGGLSEDVRAALTGGSEPVAQSRDLIFGLTPEQQNPWMTDLVQMALEQDDRNARNAAVAMVTGGANPPALDLPPALGRMIGRIASNI